MSPASAGVEYLVIPAAGLGTRVRKVHPLLPKEMLPVGGRPAISYALDEGLHAGIRNIILVINRQKEVIRRYVENDYPRSRNVEGQISFHFAYQESPLGEADAIARAEPTVQVSNIAVIYPDNIYSRSPQALKSLVEAFLSHGKDVTALTGATGERRCHRPNVIAHPLEGDLFSIGRIYPKSWSGRGPSPPGGLRTCGFWVGAPHLFSCIRVTRNLSATGEHTDYEAKKLILEKYGLLGCRLPGTMFDIGLPEGYMACRRFFGE